MQFRHCDCMHTYVDTSNEIFFAEFESLSQSFSCRFVGHYKNKSCEIAYVGATNQTCPLDKENLVWHMNSSDNLMLDTIIVFIPSLAQTSSKLFCFTAVGKTPTFTIVIEGTFTIGMTLYTVSQKLSPEKISPIAPCSRGQIFYPTSFCSVLMIAW